MRIAIILFLSIAAEGCVHHMILPRSNFNGCGFVVVDDRPDPDYFYAKGGAVVQIRPTPSIADSVKGAVCSAVNPQLLKESTFTITDFSCLVLGFFKMTYIVELRGILTKGSDNPLEMGAGKKVDTIDGYVPAGCEKAASEVIPLLANKIQERLNQ